MSWEKNDMAIHKAQALKCPTLENDLPDTESNKLRTQVAFSSFSKFFYPCWINENEPGPPWQILREALMISRMNPVEK